MHIKNKLQNTELGIENEKHEKVRLTYKSIWLASKRGFIKPILFLFFIFPFKVSF
jgi:hypothetical protein